MNDYVLQALPLMSWASIRECLEKVFSGTVNSRRNLNGQQIRFQSNIVSLGH